MPVISDTLSDIEKNTDETLSTAVVTWTSPTASDNSGSVTLTSNYEPGDTFPIGETVVRYNATDPDSNKAMTSFKVTITGNGNLCGSGLFSNSNYISCYLSSCEFLKTQELPLDTYF